MVFFLKKIIFNYWTINNLLFSDKFLKYGSISSAIISFLKDFHSSPWKWRTIVFRSCFLGKDEPPPTSNSGNAGKRIENLHSNSSELIKFSRKRNLNFTLEIFAQTFHWNLLIYRKYSEFIEQVKVQKLKYFKLI